MRQTGHRAIVVGGGFFGSRIALFLAARGFRVVLLEKEAELMTRASFTNQARVHNGYHYPRSILTARSSHLNYGRFTDEYRDSLVSGITSCYAIARRGSKVTPAQFVEFCGRVGAPLREAPLAAMNLFDKDEIEVAFEVTEVTMNAKLLRQRLLRELQSAGVETRFDTTATRVDQVTDGRLDVSLESGGESMTMQANLVLNCTYSSTNDLLTLSGAERVPLKHELAEIALIEVPAALRNMAVTVIDGPFFSATPFPARGLHALTHVRYTPHFEWPQGQSQVGAVGIPNPRPPSNAERMRRDAQKFIPDLAKATTVDSMWEIKTVLPRSEGSDSRPILFRQAGGIPGLFSILGAKIDGIYDIEAELDEALTSGTLGLQ
ncbi:MAG: FAD-dependent oxidoreductase [Gemmatimonadaceae bacterium]